MNAGGVRQQVVEFGIDWQDPGSLVALKTVPYEDRPKANPYARPTRMTARAMSPAAEKRMQEQAERQKAVEAKYDWRDAVERSVHQWNERFAAVSGEAAPGEAPVTTGFATEVADPAAKPADKAKSAAKKPGDEAAPKSSTPMPVDLHPGGKIVKEFHVRWPEDLPPQLRGATDPLAVHYVRLENEGTFGKVLTHYRTAAKAKLAFREIEGGKWIDVVQKDDPKKTRSIDVFVTRAGSDDKSAKGVDSITVELLIVEVAPLAADAAPKKPSIDAKTSASR